MPRTASSQVQSRSNTKARPSANVRAGNLVANTPVLFRLPAIPTAPAQDLAVTFSEAAVSLPTATLAAVALTPAQPIVSAPVAEPVSEVSVTPHAAPQQTWWEHWSSGIVLIVLLIALATASILAWQGSSKGNSKLMADTKKEADSQSDLSNIAVPKFETQKLDLPKVEMPVPTRTNSYVEKLESPSAQNISLSPNSEDTDSSLIPNGSLSLTLDPPANNDTKSEPQSEPEPYATASLNPPVVKPQEPLFKDSELTQNKSGLSAQPASTATQRNATNSDKPALWDSSKSNVHDTSKPLTLEFSNDESSSVGNSSTPSSDSTTESPTASATLISQSSVDATDSIAPSTSGTLVPKSMQNAVRTVTPEMDQAQLFAAYRELKAPTAPAKIDNRYGNIAAAGTQTQTGMTNGTQASVVGYTQQPTQTNSQPTQTNYTLQPAQNYAGNAGLQYSATQNANTQNPAQYSNQQFQNPQYPTQPNPAQQNAAQQNPTQQYSGQQLPGQQYSAQQNPALPQYSNQPQLGVQNPNSLQLQGVANQPSTGAQGQQYGGAQVPYSMQPSQGQSLQLPAGPIGGYGAANTAPTNRPTSGTANLNSPTSPNYPSLR